MPSSIMSTSSLAWPGALDPTRRISGLVAEYIVAIDVTRVRFSADALNKGGAMQSAGAARVIKSCPAPVGTLGGYVSRLPSW